MGMYSEYLDMNLDGNQLVQKRKEQLSRISSLRGGRAVLVYACAMTKTKAPIMIDYDDLIPIKDQISNLSGDKIDIILETPGGYAEYAEQIVEYIRKKFNDVAFIIPGAAMSAGTIMAMAGDEILMSPMSSLGPIDAQITQQGKRYSAHAFLEGLNKIKEEVVEKKYLNRAYIPILQNVSPGEIQSAQNALDFAKKLVTGWLSKYKFKDWQVHSSNEKPVTDKDKKKRAAEIAEVLCNHSKWKTHGKSINIDDLRKLKLKITDYTAQPDLADAIERYFTLLKITFDVTTIFKIYETPVSQISRFQGIVQQQELSKEINNVVIKINCPNCKTEINIQANLEKGVPVKPGFIKMPKENNMQCPSPTCKNVIDLVNLKKGIEAQLKRGIVYE